MKEKKLLKPVITDIPIVYTSDELNQANAIDKKESSDKQLQ